MIKVLHVVDSLKIGSGIMSVIMNYYRNINRDNVQFDFLYFINTEKSYYNEIKELGGNIYYLEMLSLKNLPRYQKVINDFFASNASKYQIVHLHEVLLSYFILSSSKKFKISTRIVHSHNSVGAETVPKQLRNKVLCLPMKSLATDFCACSIKASNFLYGKKFYCRGKVKIINNAIDNEKFAFNLSERNQLRERLDIEGHYVIGHVGRFSEQKNHMFLIDVFHNLKKRKNNCKLILIGMGSLYDSVRNKIEALSLTDDVILLGVRNDVHKFFNAFDLFILPSLFEGLPVVGVEAQANNLPCVFSESITKELSITQYNTFISLSKSPQEWATIIDEEYFSRSDFNRSCNIRSLFKEKKFSIKCEAANLEKYYYQCIENKLNLL